MMMDSQERLQSFNKFCQEHPEMGFWEALVEWKGEYDVGGKDKIAFVRNGLTEDPTTILDAKHLDTMEFPNSST